MASHAAPCQTPVPSKAASKPNNVSAANKTGARQTRQKGLLDELMG